MTEKPSKEMAERFDRLVKSLSLALTNSALYPSNHPAFIASMDSLKSVLDVWLKAEARVELGISPDNIMLNGAFIKEESDICKGIAGHLHKKGIIAVLFTRGIAMPELLRFFTLLKENKNEKSGIAKKIGALPHLMVKEVDYSSLLTSKKTTSVLYERTMWQSLSGLSEDLKKGQLPQSKVEFMTEFLKDPKKAAAVLNTIYKEASARLDGQSTAAEIRDIFSEMNKYFEKNPSVKKGNTKQELSEIISKLDPDLVVSLFKDRAVEDGTPDLADEIFKGLSDDVISNFISSVMKKDSSVNEKIIRVFSRLSAGKNNPDSILPMVTDKLFTEKLLGRDSLSMLQNSIKGLFESHPDDDFVSQLYDLTVGAFLDKDKAGRAGAGKYSAIVREYSEFLKPDNLKKEKIRLLLNILWLETDVARFRKMCEILVSSIREIPDAHYCKTVREIFEFLADKLTDERKRDSVVSHAIEGVRSAIDTPEVVDKLISYIPAADRGQLDDIAYTLVRVKESPSARILDLFIAQADDASRGNFGYVLSRFDGNIAGSIVARINTAAENQHSDAARELYGILKSVSFHDAHRVAAGLIQSKSAQIRSWALDEFCPVNAEEKEDVFKALQAEDDPAIKKKLLITLVKTKDAEVIQRLFGIFNKGIFKNKLLLDMITLCGAFKVVEAIPFLSSTLERRPFLYTRAARTLRVQSVLSLARIGTPEAIEYILASANDRDPSVKAMCKLALGSGVDAAEKVK